MAADLDATPSQVAIAWAATVDGVTSIPIVGARRVEFLDDTVAAGDLVLTDEHRDAITAAGRTEEHTGYIYT